MSQGFTPQFPIQRPWCWVPPHSTYTCSTYNGRAHRIAYCSYFKAILCNSEISSGIAVIFCAIIIKQILNFGLQSRFYNVLFRRGLLFEGDLFSRQNDIICNRANHKIVWTFKYLQYHYWHTVGRVSQYSFNLLISYIQFLICLM